MYIYIYYVYFICNILNVETNTVHPAKHHGNKTHETLPKTLALPPQWSWCGAQKVIQLGVDEPVVALHYWRSSMDLGGCVAQA